MIWLPKRALLRRPHTYKSSNIRDWEQIGLFFFFCNKWIYWVEKWMWYLKKNVSFGNCICSWFWILGGLVFLRPFLFLPTGNLYLFTEHSHTFLFNRNTVNFLLQHKTKKIVNSPFNYEKLKTFMILQSTMFDANVIVKNIKIAAIRSYIK